MRTPQPLALQPAKATQPEIINHFYQTHDGQTADTTTSIMGWERDWS